MPTPSILAYVPSPLQPPPSTSAAGLPARSLARSLLIVRASQIYGRWHRYAWVSIDGERPLPDWGHDGIDRSRHRARHLPTMQGIGTPIGWQDAPSLGPAN